MKLFQFILIFILLNIKNCNTTIAPNIIFIFADDMGWNDVGHHGSSQILTPNIDALAYNGIGFLKHYTMHICTPSRSALITGKIPITLGMQGAPITAGESRYLPLNVTTIAEIFTKIGYLVHIVGKWHLGHKFRNVTPTARGFQSHFGYWNGFCGYKDYEIKDQPSGYNGFDLHDGYDPAYEYANTTYATDLFTEKAIEIITKHNQTVPLFLYLSHLAGHTGKNGFLEVKDAAAANAKYSHIANPGRRLYAEIINNLDESVGKVVKTLQDVKMLNNTIVIFMSDNGAQTFGIFENFGSNWPFRGLKFTLYEGGVRVPAAIWSKLINKKCMEKNVVHITDWFPTLYAAAGGDLSQLSALGLDGINQWPLFTTGVPQNVNEYLLLNIDEEMNNSAIMTRDGRFKLTQGTYNYGVYDGHYGDPGRGLFDPKYSTADVLNSNVNRAILAATNNAAPLTEAEILSLRSQFDISPKSVGSTYLNCTLNNGYCLHDLFNDPRELKDVKNNFPTEFEKLKAALDQYKAKLVPQTNNNTRDPASNPAHCNQTWFTWGEIDPALKCANYKP